MGVSPHFTEKHHEFTVFAIGFTRAIHAESNSLIRGDIPELAMKNNSKNASAPGRIHGIMNFGRFESPLGTYRSCKVSGVMCAWHILQRAELSENCTYLGGSRVQASGDSKQKSVREAGARSAIWRLC